MVDVASFHQFTGLQQKDNLQQYQIMNMHASFPHYVHKFMSVCLHRLGSLAENVYDAQRLIKHPVTVSGHGARG